MLLRRIDARNLAKCYNRPLPHQDSFIPRLAPTKPSKNTGRCTKQRCTKPRNKECIFSMCKPCCVSWPAHEKRCLQHEPHGATSQSTQRQQHPGLSPTENPSPSSTPSCTRLSSQPVIGIPSTSTISQLLALPPPTQQPEIEDWVAIPRENGQRRQGGRSARPGSNCTVYVWVTVRLGGFSCYIQAAELQHRMGSLQLPSTRHSPFSRNSPSTIFVNTSLN